MALEIRDITVCTPCAHLIANGVAWDSNGDISEEVAARQVATLGADAGNGALVLNTDPDSDGEPGTAIGTCDACGVDPSEESGNRGYWDGAYPASIIRA